MESIKNLWINLVAVGFMPWITIFGLAMYFFMRGGYNRPKGESMLAVLGLSILGQVYYAFPKTLDDIGGTVFFSLGQSLVVFGLYSFVEWSGIIDTAKDKLLAILGKAPK